MQEEARPVIWTNPVTGEVVEDWRCVSEDMRVRHVWAEAQRAHALFQAQAEAQWASIRRGYGFDLAA